MTLFKHSNSLCFWFPGQPIFFFSPGEPHLLSCIEQPQHTHTPTPTQSPPPTLPWGSVSVWSEQIALNLTSDIMFHICLSSWSTQCKGVCVCVDQCVFSTPSSECGLSLSLLELCYFLESAFLCLVAISPIKGTVHSKISLRADGRWITYHQLNCQFSVNWWFFQYLPLGLIKVELWL